MCIIEFIADNLHWTWVSVSKPVWKVLLAPSLTFLSCPASSCFLFSGICIYSNLSLEFVEISKFLRSVEKPMISLTILQCKPCPVNVPFLWMWNSYHAFTLHFFCGRLYPKQATIAFNHVNTIQMQCELGCSSPRHRMSSDR